VAARPFLFGTNTKMTQTPEEATRLVQEILRDVDPPSGVQRFVIPSFTSLAAVVAAASDHSLWVGAQNMHWATEGAYTGEISARMLTALGVDLVLLGHAERRGLFHETDADLNKKVLAAGAASLRILLCVGEMAEEKTFGVGAETVARQLKIGLHGLPTTATPRLQIAYEPVWSIGAAGTPAQPDDVAPVATHLRAVLTDRFGDAGHEIPILYGGSVDARNAGSFTALPNIDGLFVGRAAWTADGYRQVLAAGLAGRPPGQDRRASP